ncbi:phosphoglycerol transferase [Streptococcus rubneri]|jgi:phosphatidylglycerol--membrane-oligosaccharide glycerophosphotransferase|uniref:LTA synthase family protein n=1 Tax=Streptococcus rubneri TaxID=1234680 RepID=A0A4Z1DZX8_9STRE|nr:LTA synthase family protein [Streptococcus rubneri]MBK4774309.1 phosphoglycerol transferase [Streptococcus rubneri]TGN92138.1 LTA synthase family protein [Streptococcus rubneri]
MKRKKKFDLITFLTNLKRKITRTQFYYATTFVLFFFFNFYLAQNNLAIHNKATGTVLQYVNFLGILFGISFALLVVIMSQFNFKKWFPLKLIVSYFIYNTLSYLTEITLYLNNPKYKVWNLQKNPFFRTNSFLVIGILFALTVVLVLLRYHYDRVSNRKRHRDEINENYQYVILSQLLITFIVTDKNFSTLIYRTDNFLYKALEIGKYSAQQFWLTNDFLFFLFPLLSALGFLYTKGQRDFVKNKSSLSLAFFSSVTTAIVLNYFLQFSLGRTEPFLGIHFTIPDAILFQILVLTAVIFFVYICINQYWIASCLVLLVSVFFVIANFIKFGMRREPVLPSDLTWLSKPATLLGFVDSSQIVFTVMSLLAIVALSVFGMKFFFKGKIISSWKIQVLLIITMFFSFRNVMSIFSDKENGKIRSNVPIITTLNNYQDINWLGNTSNARYKGLAYVWMNQLTTEVIQKPEGYSKERLAKIQEKYRKLAEVINKERNGYLSDQTVIYILSESFSDPRKISTVEVTQNPIPNIENIMQTHTSGQMQSDGYGGGTANMEFQTLTGLPFYNISQTVSVLYTEVFPKIHDVPSISNVYATEDKIAIHLAGKSNYSRDIVYSRLDFKDFITTNTKGVKYRNEGISPSDESTYDLVIENLSPQKGQFFSVMTMQNHSPWLEANPETLDAKGQGFTSEENSKLTFYSRLLYQTDAATQAFLEKLSKIDKKITVVFYGDHLPGLYPESAFKDYPEGQYQTDYFIWSNFDAPKMDYPLVNSSDFSAMVFEQTNSKVSPYYALLTEVLKKASVDKKALEGEALEIADDLKMVEYDLISGKGYLTKDFFKVPVAK